MQFKQHYSSSSGNLYEVIASNGQRLLLEMGVPWKKLQKALNFDLKDIQACFLTHEHKDHSKAVKDVISAGINVYASAGTFTSLGLYDERRTKFIRNKDLIRLKDFQVFAFSLNHDCIEPLGYIIRAIEENEYLFFAPDTGFITQQFSYKFNIIAIECSYDSNILQARVDTNDINETLAKRLLTSHLEKSETMRYIEQFCDLSHCREIHLLHLSRDNIDKVQAQKEFEEKFMIKTVVK